MGCKGDTWAVKVICDMPLMFKSSGRARDDDDPSSICECCILRFTAIVLSSLVIPLIFLDLLLSGVPTDTLPHSLLIPLLSLEFALGGILINTV